MHIMRANQIIDLLNASYIVKYEIFKLFRYEFPRIKLVSIQLWPYQLIIISNITVESR